MNSWSRHRPTALLLVAMVIVPLQHLLAGDGRWTGRCEGVLDGDTIIVKRDRERVEIDVCGVDSPEIGQPFGREAADFATSQLKGKIVTVIPVAETCSAVSGHVKVYGRDFATLIMIEGLAWYFPRSSADPKLVKAENRAHEVERGLWSDPQPTPPWIWRTGNRPGVLQVPR